MFYYYYLYYYSYLIFIASSGCNSDAIREQYEQQDLRRVALATLSDLYHGTEA